MRRLRALLTFLWAPFHDQVGAHAVPCLEFLAFHSQRRSRRRGGVRTTRVWRRLLGVEHTVIKSVDLESDGRGGERLVARVRPKVAYRSRCSRCDQRCPGDDASPTPRRWRSLDLGTTPVFLQASTYRVPVRWMGGGSGGAVGAAGIAVYHGV